MATERIPLPVIDLQNCLPAEGKKLAAAVGRLGCFRVANHGISPETVAKMRGAVRSIMEIYIAMKDRNADLAQNSGDVGVKELFNVAPLCDSLRIYDASSFEDVNAFCTVNDVSPGQREAITAYASELHVLVMKLTSKLTTTLGVEGFSFDKWICQLRLNSYNFTPETIGSFGANTHTDSGFLAIIQEDESVGGFEIIDSAGNIMAIDPVPDTFFVNIGDMGKVWSNGRLHNVKHRVVCKEGLRRLSIVFAMLAPKNEMVEPQAMFIDSERPRLYGRVNYNKYQKLRISTKLFAGQLLTMLPLDHVI